MVRAAPHDQRPEQHRLFSAKKTARALASGCGFALAFGWVWSGALRGLLFSNFLTGSLFSGQGTSIFFAMLMAVFLLGGIPQFTSGITVSGTGAGRMRLPAWVFPLAAHGAALLPLCAFHLFPGTEGIPAVAACLGLAGGLAGLYWGAALLRLSPNAAGMALAVAALGITGLALSVTRLADVLPVEMPFPAPLALLPGCAFIALCMAWGLASRPTPPECSEEEGPLPGQRPGRTAAAMFLAVAALGMLFSADGYTAPATLTQCGLEAGGVLLALAIFRVPQGQGNGSRRIGFFASLALPPAFSLTLLPLATLWMPVFSWTLHLVTGMLLAVSLMALAGSGRTKGGTRTLAGRVLAALLAALNAGYYAGARATLIWDRDNAGLAALLCACLAALFALSRFDFRRQNRKDSAMRRDTFLATIPAAALRAVRQSLLSGLPALTRAEIVRAVISGAGFTMVMGWIWFSGMQILCPPALRTVTPPIGEGAMLFLGMLSLGCPLLGLALGRGPGKTPGGPHPHFSHGAALPFIFMLAYSIPASPASSLLFALFAGLASVCAGLYWLTAMISHKPVCVGLSFVAAGVTATLVTLAAALLPPDPPHIFLPLLIACAWPLALLRPHSPPRQRSALPGAHPTGTDIWFLAPALFLLGFLEKLLLTGNGSANPVLLCLCSALGGAAALGLAMAAPGMRGWKSACLAMLLPIPGLITGWGAAFSQCATGMVSAVVVMELSIYFDRLRASRITAVGIAAGIIAILFNIGYAIGDGVMAAVPRTESVAELLTVAVSLVAAMAVVFLGNAAMRAKRESERGALPDKKPLAVGPDIETGPAVAAEKNETPGPAKEPAQMPSGPVTDLTPTEQRIAALLRQGHNNTAISNALGIAPATTRVHLRSIHKKMGTGSREELMDRLMKFSLSERSKINEKRV